MAQKISEKNIINGLLRLKEELGREPNTTDIDECDYLPTAKTIQRRGGIAHFRALAGFNPEHHTKGAVRSKIAREANLRASKYESKIINQLFLRYHDSEKFTKTVIRHFAYQQWLPDAGHYINIACDVAIDDRITGETLMIDFFFPSTMRSYGGCVRSKRAKLQKHPASLFNSKAKHLFVCLNPKISQVMVNNDRTNTNGMEVIAYEIFMSRFLL